MSITTHRWKIPEDEQELETLKSHPAILQAAAFLKEERLVAFPTETVYGLGADATSDKAVKGIFIAKGRPADNPLIVHIGDPSQLENLAITLPKVGRELIEHFWPGPLTLVVHSEGRIAQSVTAGLPTVGVRMPSHPVALALLKVTGIPIAAPSANRSGRPSPTEADHVWTDLVGRIDGILDAGPTGVGVESTVLDITVSPPMLLRPGGITAESLQQVIGKIQLDPALDSAKLRPRSPGMKYRHYAPKGEVWLVSGEGTEQIQSVRAAIKELQLAGKKVGVLTTEERVTMYNAKWVIPCGRRSDPASVAQGLYRALRRFDEVGAEVILVETFPEKGILASVMNRLEKAAEGRIYSPKD